MARRRDKPVCLPVVAQEKGERSRMRISVASTRGRVVLSAIVLTLLTAAAPALAQSYTVLHPFKAAQQNPGGLVQASDGNFYGTTNRGGANSLGSVFKITPAGTLTTLYSFAGSDGRYLYAGLVQGTDGNFYGTTNYGGTRGNGTVFKITPAGTLTTLHAFAGSDGASLYAGVVQGTDGSFYGTASQSGPLGGGVV